MSKNVIVTNMDEYKTLKKHYTDETWNTKVMFEGVITKGIGMFFKQERQKGGITKKQLAKAMSENANGSFIYTKKFVSSVEKGTLVLDVIDFMLMTKVLWVTVTDVYNYVQDNRNVLEQKVKETLKHKKCDDCNLKDDDCNSKEG